MKKSTSTILLLLFSIVAISQDFTVDGIPYTITSGTSPFTVEVGGVPGGERNLSGSVVIPETVSNSGTTYTVTAIGVDAFKFNNTITSVTLPNSVTTIDTEGFRSTTALVSINLGTSLQTIGSLAFFDNNSLTQVTLPASVTSVASRAFENADNLASVTLEGSTPPTVTLNSTFKTTAIGSGTLTVPPGSLSTYQASDWGSLGFNSIVEGTSGFPADFTIDNITYSVTSLSPNEVEVAPQGAGNGTPGDFEGDVVIPETVTDNGTTYTVTAIGDRAFEENGNVTSLSMPNTITEIGVRAFIRTSISSIIFSNTLEKIGELAFFDNQVTQLSLPATLTSIGSRAFEDSGNLSTVILAASTPPTLAPNGMNIDVFKGTDIANGNLFVPTADVTTYENNADWAGLGFGSIAAIVPVTGITLDVEAGMIEFGDSTTLAATVVPANASNRVVIWTTDNESVATVENGKVKGIGIGIATITATTEEGGFTDTFTATVTGISVESMTLNDDEEVIEIGNTYQLIATILPENADDKSVIWSSSDEAVATVSDAGLVTAVAQGTATITVTTTDGGFTDTFTAMVPGPPVESVSLNDDEETIEAGDTYQLTATVLPGTAEDKSVIWSSDNESVATVSDAGLVTAVDEGTATITVTTVDGGRTATFVATVIVAVASVELNDEEETILIGETYTLTATVLPANAMDKSVTWRSSNETVATVSDQGVITGLVPGQSLITVTTVDGNLQDTFIITVGTILSVAPGIEKSIVIYPNPTTSSIHVKGVSNAALEMYDLSGSIIIKDRINQSKPFSLPGLKPGVYIVNVIDNDNSYQTRLIIE